MRQGNHETRLDRIRQRSYELWQQAGEPGGRDEEFWHKAEAEINAEDQRNDARHRANLNTPPDKG